MTSATCYACTKVLGESVAGLPRKLFQAIAERKELQTEIPANELLNEQPNPEMDPFTFWELNTARLVNRGNAFSEIQRDNADRPIALWPIHNSRVRPVREPDGSLMWEISHDYSGSPEFADPTWRQEHYAICHRITCSTSLGLVATQATASWAWACYPVLKR